MRHALAMFAIGTMLVFAAIGVGRTVSGWQLYNDLHTTGTRTQADVIAKRDNLPLLRSFFLTYRYTAGGEVIEREERVSRGQYNNTAVGDALTVTYDPNTPALVLIEDNNRELLAFTLTTAGWVVAGLASAGIYIWYTRRLALAQARHQELWDDAMERINTAIAERGDADPTE